jgi:excisionase family DNA binding protein
MTHVLKTSEVLTRLRLKDPDAVYALIRSGRLRAVKLGREYRVPEPALEAFLNGADPAGQAQAESAAEKIRAAKPAAVRNAPATMKR